MNEICILICLHVWKVRHIQFHNFISIHLDQYRKDVDYCIEHQVYFFLGISIASFFCFLLLLTIQIKQSCSYYKLDCCWSCCSCCCDYCDSIDTFLFFTLLCVSVLTCSSSSSSFWIVAICVVWIVCVERNNNKWVSSFLVNW